MRLTLPAGTSCTVDARALESGSGLACGVPQGGLGDGDGKWRLTVASTPPLVALGLLSSPAGHLTNLSGTAAPDADGTVHVDFFPAAGDAHGRQGFVRVANRSGRSGTVRIQAFDDTDVDYEALTLSLGAGAAAQFNADDLELGNRSKGLAGSTGAGTGAWRLALSSADIEFEAGAYVRSADGLLTAMNAVAPGRFADPGWVHRVATFNPGSNWRQVSLVRLVNRGGEAAQVALQGADDTGVRPGGTVSVTVPAGRSVTLGAKALEDGGDGFEGALGDGAGKWRLRVASDRPVSALSLLSSPSGHLTNLSRADGSRGFRHGLLPPPGSVVLDSPYECELRGRWDAVAGARYAVDLLRGGVRDAQRSVADWAHPRRTWSGLCVGAFRVRVCSLNEDGDCGPWSAESNEVVID